MGISAARQRLAILVLEMTSAPIPTIKINSAQSPGSSGIEVTTATVIVSVEVLF